MKTFSFLFFLVYGSFYIGIFIKLILSFCSSLFGCDTKEAEKDCAHRNTHRKRSIKLYNIYSHFFNKNMKINFPEVATYIHTYTHIYTYST